MDYLIKKNPNDNINLQVNNIGQIKKQKGHTSASSTLSTSFTPNSIILGQDNKLMIYQDKPISQKTTNE